MTFEDIPDAVRRFVLMAIPSVPFLEALLLMQQVPQAAWDAHALARRLYMSERAGASILGELQEAGFIAEDSPGTFHYSPRSDEIRELVIAVRDAYARNLVGMTNLIHAKTNRKAQQFADAFKLRKD